MRYVSGRSKSAPRTRELAATLVSMILAIAPAAGIDNGQLDGSGHPAVGFLEVGDLQAPCQPVAFGCSGVLVAPQILLSTARCVTDLRQSAADFCCNSTVWMSFTSGTAFPVIDLNDPDCSARVHAVDYAVHPGWDPKTGNNNVGLIFLDRAPDGITPVQLPAQNEVASLPKDQIYTLVAFGWANDGEDYARRYAPARASSLGAQSVTLAINGSAGSSKACVSSTPPVNEGGAAFLGANRIEALVVRSDSKSCKPGTKAQRLDIASVRDFMMQEGVPVP